MRLSDLKAFSSDTLDVGNDVEFESVGTLKHQAPHMLSFIEGEKYIPTLKKNGNIRAVITSRQLAPLLENDCAVLIADNPRRAFFLLHNALAEKSDFYWQDFPSEISSEAQIHPTAYIAPRNVRIGRGTVVEPHVTILERTVIGEDVILRAGCTVGSQGFEFKRIDGNVLNVAHAGGVRLGDRVEIQANCALSRSIYGRFTQLGNDTKLDNLVHIAHHDEIGERCFIAASAMIAGSVTIGNDVWIGPGACISNEITIGDNASITIGAVVTRDVQPGDKVSGNFAIDHDKFIAFIRSIR